MEEVSRAQPPPAVKMNQGRARKWYSIDELGSMELDRRSAELLFQVLTEREDKNSVAIASTESLHG